MLLIVGSAIVMLLYCTWNITNQGKGRQRAVRIIEYTGTTQAKSFTRGAAFICKILSIFTHD